MHPTSAASATPTAATTATRIQGRMHWGAVRSSQGRLLPIAASVFQALPHQAPTTTTLQPGHYRYANNFFACDRSENKYEYLDRVDPCHRSDCSWQGHAGAHAPGHRSAAYVPAVRVRRCSINLHGDWAGRLQWRGPTSVARPLERLPPTITAIILRYF